MFNSTWIGSIKKLSAIYAGLLMLAALSLLVVVYVANEVAGFSESEAVIDSDIEGLSDVYRYGGEEALLNALKGRIKSGTDSAFYFLTDQSGEILTGNFASLPDQADEIVPPYLIYEIPFSDLMKGSPEGREFLSDHFDVLADIRQFDNGWVLFVGRDIEFFQTGKQVIEAFSYFVFLLLALFALIGFAVSSHILRRIHAVTATAEEIVATGDLSKRIDVNRMSGEFSELGGALNQMLAKIQALVNGVKQVSDDIAHDLRTPLTRLQHHLEGLAKRSPGDDIEAAVGEAKRLVSTFNALLRIAKIENKESTASFATVDLVEVLEDVREYYEPFAEENGISFVFENRVNQCSVVRGDKHMLFQAFSNLIENAIRHAPESSTISFHLTPNDANGVNVVVRDEGPGIPDTEKKRVFDRFYRLESSRSSPGSGLGLAMVKAVVNLHDGEVSLADSTPQGLEVHMFFRLTKS